MKPILTAISIALAALALFLCTLSTHPFPGPPSAMLATHLGASPFAAVDQPLYGMAVRFLDRMCGPAQATHAAHLFSAVLGAMTCGLLVLCTTRMSFAMLSRHPQFVENAPRASLIAGAVAGLALMSCLPFWILATRSYPDITGLFLIVLCLWCVLQSLFTRRQPWVSIASLVFGLGLAEFASFIGLIFPYLLFLGVLSTRRGGRFNWRLFMGQCLLMLAGFLIILQTAWFAWCSPSAAYRGWTSFGSALWACFKHQHALALRVIPPIGWLSLFGQTYLPLILLLVLRPRLRAKRGPIYLYLLLTVLLVAVLLDASFLSPLRMLNAENRIDLVFGTPYLAVAISCGLLAGVWWSRLRHDARLVSPLYQGVRKAMRFAFVPFLALCFVGLGWRHLPVADGRVARLSHEWTRGILQSLGSRSVLVADSWVNTLVSLEARATGVRELRVISPDLAGGTPYLRWLSAWQETPALQSLATVGVGPLLQGMLTAEPPMYDRLALHWQDAPLAACGLEAVPAADLFLPAAAGTPPEDPARWAVRAARLDALPLERLAEIRDARHPLAPYAAEWLRIQSKLANNHGVALARAGRTDLADEAYRAALRLHPDNVSALLNRVELSRTASPPPPDLEQIHRDFAKFMEELGTGRYRIWALASAYGMLASPEAFADRGMYWAVSGRPARAIQDLRRAMDMAGEDARLQVAVAGAMFAGGDPVRAAEEYTRVLQANPADRNAMLGLARVAALQGNYSDARASLSRLAEGREPDGGLLVEQAVVDLLEGLEKDAIKKAVRATELAPGDARAWTLLASLSARVGDAGEFNRAIERMLRMSTLAVHTRHAIAALLWQQGRSDEARRLARSILESHPTHMPTLDLSLRMAVTHRDHVTAWQCIPRILETEPSNAYALMILGSLHYFEHRLGPAEQAFRARLAVERSLEALNSLAYVLYELNQPEEALPLAEEALSLNRAAPETWDTLAMIQLSMLRLDDAITSSRKAVELAPELLDLQLHLAMVHTERGELDPAWNLIEQLMVRKAALSSPAQVQLDTFRVKLQRLRDAKSSG